MSEQPDPIITCPICSKNFKSTEIDAHLDFCLGEAEDIIPNAPLNPSSSLPLLSEKQPNETWSEYYARRGKELIKNDANRVVVPPSPYSNSKYVPPIPPPNPLNNINNQYNNNNNDFLEFSVIVKCPWGDCKDIHIDNFVDHVNEHHHSAANQKHVCPICEMYSPGLYLQQNQNTRLVDHLNQIHATVEDDLWEEVPEEWLKEEEEGEEETFGIPKLHFSDLQIAEYQLTEITASGLADVECQICVDEFLTNQMVIRMECFCVFHSNCAKQWFSKQSGRNVCPIHRDDTTRK